MICGLPFKDIFQKIEFISYTKIFGNTSKDKKSITFSFQHFEFVVVEVALKLVVK